MRVLAPPASTNPNNGASADIALASTLLDQPRLRDHDVMRQRLTHVVNGQCRDARACQRFHLDASLVMNRDRASNHGVIAIHVDHDRALLDRSEEHTSELQSLAYL